MIITASNDLLDAHIVISTFDENGNKVDEKKLRAASAWNTEYSNNYVAIIGSKNLTLINIVTGEILRVNAQQAIDYTYIDNDLLSFVINAGLDKESGKYQSNVCLLELDGRLNYDEKDYVCNQVENVLFDIVLRNGNILFNIFDLVTLEEYLVFLDSDLNRLEQKEIPTLGSYFRSVSEENIIIYNFDEYFIYPSRETIKTEAQIDGFTFVDPFKNGFLRTNYNQVGTEIYYEEISDDNTLKSERLFSSHHLTVESCNDSSVAALYERTKNGNAIRFYDVDAREFKTFSYQVKDSEKVLGAYYTR